jgi:plastocyanin
VTKQHALRTVTAAAAAAGLVLGLSACGGSSGSSAAGVPAGAPATIVIKNFAFAPASLTVASGSTVTVHNEDNSTHTVTADAGQFDTGNIKPGQTVTFQVHSAGTLSYHCSIHQFMHGSITVKG